MLVYLGSTLVGQRDLLYYVNFAQGLI